MISAFLSFLVAFNVEPKVVQEIEMILRAPSSQTVPLPSSSETPLPTSPVPTVPSMPDTQPVKALHLTASLTEVEVAGEQSSVIKVIYTIDGVSKKGVVVSMETPDPSQNDSGALIAADSNEKVWSRGFLYHPKTTGKHTLTFTAEGATASIDIEGK